MTIDNKLQRIVNETWDWICAKYGIDSVSSIMPEVIYFKKGSLDVKGRAAYAGYIPGKDKVMIGRYRVPGYWLTYIRRGMKEWAYNIPCKKLEVVALTLVHEFTHAIQSRQGRRYYEAEPTKNEIEYAREFFPHLAKHLQKVKDGGLTVKMNEKNQIIISLKIKGGGLFKMPSPSQFI